MGGERDRGGVYGMSCRGDNGGLDGLWPMLPSRCSWLTQHNKVGKAGTRPAGDKETPVNRQTTGSNHRPTGCHVIS